ncbi:hypothetical protein HPB50_005626 [Hyalomma asiaticum]|uniref:Uncharacterized protein n=1 Tax=Hyalomma asiaticum TaxID=266040 RepID=A0ACB7RY58_HYAAI|nr:hypothetical protein HPB50_005626 [Hyalomma asiaticum]
MQYPKARALRCTDWEIYRATLEHSDTSDMTYEEFIGALSQTKRSSTKYLKLPGKRTTIDIEYERLRAMRRRSERRARKTLSREDIREARRMQRHIQRHLDKLDRRQWRAFCSKLDPRKPLSRIWNIARSLRIPPAQKQPFSSVALFCKVSELDMAEAFCAKPESLLYFLIALVDREGQKGKRFAVGGDQQ